MSFPIIGTPSVWTNWSGAGTGAWRMWFMAPYGSWMYCGFVKNNAVSFKKVEIGSTDTNYDIYDWTFGSTSNTPEDLFPYEQHEGGIDSAIGCGVIRGNTPHLYLLGRSTSAVSTDTILHKFQVDNSFEGDLPGTIPLEEVAGNPININHVAGIEVDPGTAYYIVTNNNDSNDFELRRFAYTFDGGSHAPSHTRALSTQFMEDNTNARIRGISIAIDGNILVFVNDGVSATSAKVLKFDKDDLSYLGQTSWAPEVASSIWGHVVTNSEVYMYFQGLDSIDLYSWKLAIYYDGATAIPSSEYSNFVVEDNLTQFGSETAITLKYTARDAFNIPVIGVNTKFVLNGEDENDSSTWTDTLGSIQDNSGDTFFDANNVPTAISAIVATNGSGVATAYYKPMRSGTGTLIDAIDVYCPSDV